MFRFLLPLGVACLLAVTPANAGQAPTVSGPVVGTIAGAIVGTVIDDRTERPLRGVLVFVDGQAQSAETDDAGRFTLAAPKGPQTVSASVVGYALLRADVEVGAAPLDMTIRLSEGAGAYSERVTVSGSRRGESESAPGGGALYGRELETLRGLMLDDPMRALQALPAASATDDFYSEFAVRGNAFRHVGLVVDGMPTRYLTHTIHRVTDGGSIAMVNSESLGSISLLPGGYPQRTGRRLGAQIDMTTRDGNRDKFHGRAGLSGTSATFLGEGPLAGGRGSWLASFRRSYLDYLIKRIEPDAGFAFGFYDGQAKVVFDVTPRHQVSLTTILGRTLFDHEEGTDDNDLVAATSHSWLTAIAWRYAPGPRFTMTQRLYSTGEDFDNRNPFGGSLDAARSTDVGWRLDASMTPRAGWLIDAGADAQRLTGRGVLSRRTSATSGFRLLNRYDEHASAGSAYAQIRVPLGARLSVTPGARLDRWSLLDTTTTSPWMTAELQLGGRTRLRAGTGIYRQFADIEQVVGLRRGGTTLRPERAAHADIGIDRSLSANTRVSLALFTRQERDVLWTPGSEPRRRPDGSLAPGFADAPWVNTLRGRARGFEVTLRRDAGDGLAGWAGYGYGRNRYTTSTGETFAADFEQAHTLSLYGSYRFSNRTSLSAKFRYGSNHPIVGYIAEDPAAPIVDGQPLFHTLAGARNTTGLPLYARLDVRADRAFNWGGRRLVLFAEVANTLNHVNMRNTPYRTDRNGRVFEAIESLMPIVPSAGFVVEF
jgi:hypothetical protein